MEIFQFDREERGVTRYGSSGVVATRIAAGDGAVPRTLLKVEAGGTIGTHPAPSPGTGNGFTALAVEGLPLALFAREAPRG